MVVYCGTNGKHQLNGWMVSASLLTSTSQTIPPTPPYAGLKLVHTPENICGIEIQWTATLFC